MVRRNLWATKALDAFIGNCIGTGISLGLASAPGVCLHVLVDPTIPNGNKHYRRLFLQFSAAVSGVGHNHHRCTGRDKHPEP